MICTQYEDLELKESVITNKRTLRRRLKQTFDEEISFDVNSLWFSPRTRSLAIML